MVQMIKLGALGVQAFGWPIMKNYIIQKLIYCRQQYRIYFTCHLKRLVKFLVYITINLYAQ